MTTIHVLALLACACPTASPFLTPAATYALRQASQSGLFFHRSTGARTCSPGPFSALRGGASSVSSSRSSTSSTMASTSYDVVVFGATSFVGQLICEYLLQNYGASPSSFKWAVAARSESKLIALKERLSSEYDTAASTLPIIVADSFDDEAIAEMVSQAKVVLSTVGPFTLYGNKLIAACVAAGVHCCDLAGESLWLRELIDRHHEEAEQTGAKIVPSCGFDSVPADIGTLMMMEHMKRTHGVCPSEVRYFFGKSKGGVSGGTVASVLGVFEKVWEGGKSVMKKMNDPLLLTSSTDAFEKAGDPGGLGYDRLSKSWTAPSFFAGHDAKIVFRSAELLDYPKDFQYKEVASFKGPFGFVPAMFATVATSVGGLLMFMPATRNFIAKRFLPAPGEGPSKEVRDTGFFWIDLFAKGQSADGKEVVCRGTVGSDKGDNCYKETAKMLAECGLCLALEDVEYKKGGILTTATAMGMPLVDRLNKAGMTFKVEE